MPRGFHLARTCGRDGRLSQQGQRHGPGHSLRPGNTLQPGISRRPGSSAQTDSDRFLPTASSEDSLLAKRLSSTSRITGPGYDVNERSEPARLFRLRFIRLLCIDHHVPEWTVHSIFWFSIRLKLSNSVPSRSRSAGYASMQNSTIC